MFVYIYVYVYVCIYILPLRKTTDVVENIGFHVFSIGLKCNINYFVLYIYMCMYSCTIHIYMCHNMWQCHVCRYSRIGLFIDKTQT